MPKTAKSADDKPILRGGRRPGAGRRPIEGVKLDHTILIRITPAQKKTFSCVGGSAWVRRMLEANGVSLSTLPMMGKPSTQERHVPLPLAQTPEGAGENTPISEYDVKDIDLNNYLVDNPEATFLLRASTDSMSDLGIYENDMLVVDRSYNPQVNDIVVMLVDNAFYVRRYCRDDKDAIYLHAENASADYPDMRPEQAHEWKCFGVVRHVIKSL